MMKTRKASLPMLFSVVFMDMVGFGFIIPLIPDYIAKFGGRPALAGILQASYAVGQFFAAPIVGRLSDKYGRKPLFLFSIGGTFLSLLLLGFAPSLVFIFLSRILDGLTGGNITVAQSYIVDITDNKNRAKGLGLIGMAFGLGFIVGPIFGGLLSRFGLSVPACVAAGIAFINLMLIGFALPESLTADRKEEISNNPRRAFSPKLLLETLKRRGTGPVLKMTIIYSFAFVIFEGMFAIFASTALGLDGTMRGILLAYVGLLVAFVQGGLVGFLAKKFDERKLALVGITTASAALLLYALSPSLPVLVIALFPLSIGSGIGSTMLRTLLSKSVPRESLGGTLGLAGSVESLTRVAGPLAGGTLLGLLGPRAPGIAASILAAIAAWYGFKALIKEDCLVDGATSCSDERAHQPAGLKSRKTALQPKTAVLPGDVHALHDIKGTADKSKARKDW